MINTTLKSAIPAGNNVIATPYDMTAIGAGSGLIVGGEADTETGRGELVVVISVTATTFTANFVHPHEKRGWVFNDPAFHPACVMWGT